MIYIIQVKDTSKIKEIFEYKEVKIKEHTVLHIDRFEFLKKAYLIFQSSELLLFIERLIKDSQIIQIENE